MTWKPVGSSKFTLEPRKMNEPPQFYGWLVLVTTLLWASILGVPLLAQLLPARFFPGVLKDLTKWRWESAAAAPVIIAVSLLLSWALWLAKAYQNRSGKRFI